jgi:hypothetical protein
VEIIIRKPKGWGGASRNLFGRTRSQIEETIKRHGVNHGLTPEQIDKCKYVERKTGKQWPSVEEINRVK